MEFRPLQSFVEVIRQGGFTRAAETILTTQSAVSKAVKQLEEEVGANLLIRIGRKVVLTATGEVVYRYGTKLLGDREAMLNELAAIRSGSRGYLRVGLASVFSGALIAPLIAAYRKQHPDVVIQIEENEAGQLLKALQHAEIELAGVAEPVPDSFEFLPFRSEPIGALLPASYPVKASGGVYLHELRETPFVFHRSESALQNSILGACRNLGFEPKIAARTDQIGFMAELVSIGMGVGFLPLSEAPQIPNIGDRAKVAPLHDDRLVINAALVWPAGALLSKPARDFAALTKVHHGMDATTN